MNRNNLEPMDALGQKLKAMKLSGMADELERQTEDPNTNLMTFEERITLLINSEWDLRYSKKLARYMKKAELRYPQADFDDTLYDPDRQLDTDTIERLMHSQWIEEGRNLLVTGVAGAGKSYFVNALCVKALQEFKTVRYAKASGLIHELEKAELEKTYLEFMKSIAGLDILVLDDFGLMDLDPDKCRNLFEVIDSREGRKSIIVVSQLPVSSWYSLFKDNTYADSCLDRLVSKAYRLEFKGKNMRNPELNK